MLREALCGTLLTLIAVSGCNPPDDGNDAPVKIDISTWWTKAGEKDALARLEDINNEAHRNVTLFINRGTDAEEAFAALDSRLYLQNPPDTFQANGGSRLLSRVVQVSKNAVTSTDTIPQLEDLRPVYARNDVKLWPDLERLVMVNGIPYGVPLNVHRINNLYFSIEKLKRLRGLSHLDSYDELALPTSIDGFIDLAKQLTPIVGEGSVGIGVYDSWTLETLVFENILSSVALSDMTLGGEDARKQFFELFWMGRKPPTDEVNYRVVEKTLLETQALWPYVKTFGQVGKDDGQGDWTKPFDALCDANSPVALVVMGDWATGYLKSKNAVEGTDFGVVPFPGSEKLYILTTDTLPLTIDAKHRNETADFLATALTDTAQLGFSELKGSVPAIQTEALSSERFGPYQRQSQERLGDETFYKSTAMSGLLSPDLPTETLRDGLYEMLNPAQNGETDIPPDVLAAQRRSIVHNILKNDYWLLKEWTDTLEDFK